MKYEAVFGNQELFDGAGTFTGLDVVVHSIASGIKSCARLSDLTPESLRNHPVCAMRRIIKEPKHWTWEDKKAGRLPEVGWVVMAIDVNEVARIAAINNDSVCSVCVVFEDGGFITLPFSGIAPIETPAEKAQREEDEFVVSELKKSEAAVLKWISVKDKTPKHEPGKWSDPVIAMSDIGLVFRLSYCGGWQRTGDFMSTGSSKVTHWIPMPKFAGDENEC